MSHSTINKIKQLREKILSYEYPYDASAWDQLEEKLNTSSGNSFALPVLSSAVFMVGLIALSFALKPAQQSTAGEQTAGVNEVIPPIEMNENSDKNEAPQTEEAPKTTTVYSLDNTLDKRELVRPIQQSDRSIESAELDNGEPLDELEMKEAARDQEFEPVKKDLPTDVPYIKTSRNSVCSGAELDIEILGEIKGCQVLVDRKLYEALEKMSIVFAQSGEQRIELLNGDGKLLNEYTVIVHAAPEALIEARQTLEFGGRPVLEYSTSKDKGNKYLWYINDEFQTDRTEGYRLLREKGSFIIRLEAVNKLGCRSSSTEHVLADRDYNLLAPNSFSPNGDGRNETWMPAGLDLIDGSFVLEIFDRNQQLVYRTSSFNEPWNGDINGSPAPAGNFYMWQAIVITKRFGKQMYRGRILVL